MRARWIRVAGLTVVVASLAAAPVLATMLQQFNLTDLVERADRIYRGTVVKIDTGTVPVGGGDLPTITYTIRVDQAFKGTFDEIKGQQFTTLTTVGKIAPVTVGNAVRLSALSDLPRLEMGSDYLLFTTPPSSGNLSSPVGLGQGCFDIKQKDDGSEVAINRFQNIGLFQGMDLGELETSGPVEFQRMGELVRTELSRVEGGVQ